MSAAAAIATIAGCKLIEEGTHEELIAKQGKYYVLWEMQQGNIVKEHVDKHAKEVYMTWNPSKKTIKIGNVLCAVGSVMAGEGNKNVGRIFGAATIISATRS